MIPFNNIQQYTLYLEQFCSQWQVDPQRAACLNSDNLTLEFVQYAEHIAIRMQHEVYASKPKSEVHIVKHPLTWWDAFKLEYPRLCKWLSPAKMKVHAVKWTGKLLFPDIPPREGNERTFVYWSKATDLKSYDDV